MRISSTFSFANFKQLIPALGGELGEKDTHAFLVHPYREPKVSERYSFLNFFSDAHIPRRYAQRPRIFDRNVGYLVIGMRVP